MIKKKKVGIVCCSNGLKSAFSEKQRVLEEILKHIGMQPVFSECIYEKNGLFRCTARERAKALMDFYEDDSIEEIFDISGGDLANGILPYLDYERIAKSNKRFWGYSDLTTVLNAIYAKTGKASVLYQVRNVLSEYGAQHEADLRNILLSSETENFSIFKIRYRFIQGAQMQGRVIGGNIRCFLKLAGTEYMPDFQDKILLLESRSGLVPQMETFFSQLQQLGAFDKVKGILLGTFTQMEQEGLGGSVLTELVKSYVGADMPIAVTPDIGHGRDSKAIIVGSEMYL